MTTMNEQLPTAPAAGVDDPQAAGPDGWPHLGDAVRVLHERRADRQLKVSAWLLGSALAVIGVLLIILSLSLSGLASEQQQILLEAGISLALFGVTTLVLTFVVTDALDERLKATITEQLTDQTELLVRQGDEGYRRLAGITEQTRSDVKITAEQIRPLGGNWRELGLTDVFLTRSDALERGFGEQIHGELNGASLSEPADAEVLAHEVYMDGPGDTDTVGYDPAWYQPESDRCRLWIVSSCMKGFLENASKDFDGLGLLSWAAELAKGGRLDLRVLLTHPKYAHLRAAQEHRPGNAIRGEIQEALDTLRQRGVPRDRVRLVDSTPTVFAVATRDHMLLNPYPHSQEAYRSFTLTVRRSKPGRSQHVDIHRDIFEQYAWRHFILPWINARTVIVPQEYWVGCDPQAGEGPVVATPPVPPMRPSLADT
jgi:hypothetical protein